MLHDTGGRLSPLLYSPFVELLAASISAPHPAAAARQPPPSGLAAPAAGGGANGSAPPPAERLWQALLSRPSLRAIDPLQSLRFHEYIGERLDEVDMLRARGAVQESEQVLRVLASCFPRWAATLRLLAALAARAEPLRLEWHSAGAVQGLVALLQTQADPQVRGHFLDTS